MGKDKTPLIAVLVFFMVLLSCILWGDRDKIDKEVNRSLCYLGNTGTILIETEYNTKTLWYYDKDVKLTEQELTMLLYISNHGNYTIRYEGKTFNP